MSELKNNLLKKIKSGEIDMKPRWHFMLKAGLLLFGIVVAALLAIYFLSFTIFFIRQTGLFMTPGLGFYGLSYFILTSPWLLIGASLGFLLVLYLLVKHYSFSYKQPLLYSLLALVLLALLGSTALNKALLHQRIGGFMADRPLPVMAPMYRQALDERPEGLSVGTITSLTDDGFVLETERGESLIVSVNSKTRLARGYRYQVGESVLVLGFTRNNEVVARGVRPFDNNKLRAEMRGERFRESGFGRPAR